MKNYIYLAEHYDVLDRPCPCSDKKVGYTEKPSQREKQLGRTKSPIGVKFISCYKVDDAPKVEKMIHALLDSRRTSGEWFDDEQDTLTGEIESFMDAYGAEPYEIEEIEREVTGTDDRLVRISEKFGRDIKLIRKYKGENYHVLLDTKGLLHFNGEVFDTPNKLYNNGIVKFVKGKRGNSGTNGLSQFIVEETGKRLEITPK